MRKIVLATMAMIIMVSAANADGMAQKYGAMSSVDKNSNTSKAVVMVAGAVAGSALGYAIMAESGAGMIAKVGIGSLVGVTGTRVGKDIYNANAIHNTNKDKK